ncbi:MAG: stage 0 sporulation family protein [Thermodesulfobacteriota bacterium]|nr:stage 0 sporulation family protein [Thermodesulfobacteriota bacterium]
MNKVVRVQFEKYGRVHDFDSGHFVLKKNDIVLVETEQGPALGVVCAEPKSRCEHLPERPIGKIFRLANRKDIDKFEKKCQSEKDVYVFCYGKIKERSLPMSLVSVERLFDGSKIIIFFTADRRVDFRELVKDLVQRFRTRVEMRQIGVRHQAKMVGALGSCGRQLCCASFLNDFAPVSIRMAKQQNLSLKPSKISGMCGRLMCCLTFEYEYYEGVKKNFPKIGKKVNTKHGQGKVIRQNVLRETFTISIDSGEEIEVSCDDIIKDAALQKNTERSNH